MHLRARARERSEPGCRLEEGREGEPVGYIAGAENGGEGGEGDARRRGGCRGSDEQVVEEDA